MYFAKLQPISKPISNQKGAIGKPKKHTIWAAHPRTHLSTKYPPPPDLYTFLRKLFMYTHILHLWVRHHAYTWWRFCGPPW